MRRIALLVLTTSFILSAGCAGLSRVSYNRFDRGRKVVRIAVVANNPTKADRYKMWAWTKKRPRILPPDTFTEEIVNSLSATTDYHILSAEVVREALERLGLEETSVLTLSEMRALRRLTGANAILFADVSLYLQNYLFYKTFGVVQISMRLVGTPDGALLWAAKGENFALLVSTDSALEKLREKMLAQLTRKLERDKPMTI